MLRLILVFAFMFKFVSSQPPPSVITKNGPIVGIVKETLHGRKFNAFYRIPYAKPPIGSLRFKEPVPADPWIGTWKATHKPEICLQRNWNPNAEFDINGSEDCLYVNVFTPKLPDRKKDKLLDVLVNIHGGALQILSGDTYGPDYILDHDLVYVTFNYRLNIMGFLSFGDDVVPGNNGLKDQYFALKWIKENIALFGGDPNKITISGMSAGAASVHYHLLNKKTKGLFKKAILSSGSALSPWASSRNFTKTSVTLTAQLGCPTQPTRKALKCLQQRPAADIIRGLSAFQFYTGFPITPIGVAIEKPGPQAYVVENPYEVYKHNEFNDVPVLWTVNAHEGFFVPDMALSHFYGETVDRNWDDMMPIVLELTESEPEKQLQIVQKLRKLYMDGKTVKDSPDTFLELYGDRLVNNGFFESAELLAKHAKSPQWMYTFSHKGPARHLETLGFKEGACHGEDVGYALKTGYNPVAITQSDIDVIDITTKIWVDFIQNKPSWAPLNNGQLNFPILEIAGPDPQKNVVKPFERTPGQKLWLSFGLPPGR